MLSLIHAHSHTLVTAQCQNAQQTTQNVILPEALSHPALSSAARRTMRKTRTDQCDEVQHTAYQYRLLKQNHIHNAMRYLFNRVLRINHAIQAQTAAILNQQRQEYNMQILAYFTVLTASKLKLKTAVFPAKLTQTETMVSDRQYVMANMPMCYGCWCIMGTKTYVGESWVSP